MKIRYLGTAAAEGWPALFCECGACQRARAAGGKNRRTRSQALIDEELLIDFPADTYLHCLNGGLALPRIRWLLITHSHDDHFYPLDLMLRMDPYAHSLHGSLEIYANQTVAALLTETASRFSTPEIWNHLSVHPVQAYAPFEAGDYRVTPLPANHMPAEQALIYLIERGGRRLLYCHDSGPLPANVLDALCGQRLDFVSLDCTLGPQSSPSGHMGLPNDRELRQWLLENGCADEATLFVVNHFSHNGGLLHEELEAQAGGEFTVAYDGMECEI